MHPKALLEACSELVRLTLKFDHPADAIVSKFFRDNRGLGPRERATMAGASPKWGVRTTMRLFCDQSGVVDFLAMLVRKT